MRTQRLVTLVAAFVSAAAFAFQGVQPAFAQGEQSARALALAGSIVAQPVGPEAVPWNPAALQFGTHGFELNLLGMGTRVRNNSFTIGDYNRYTGATLSDADKEYILGQVPANGLRLDAAADLEAFTLTRGAFAVSITSQGAANLDLSRDALELLLFGNTVFDTVTLSGTGGESFLTAGIGVSAARPLALVPGGELSGGVTLRYVRGIFVQQVVRSYGELTTDETGLVGDAEFVARSANNGKGIAADAGLLYRLSERWSFGASVTNLIGSVTWDGHPEEYRFTFEMDTLNVLNAGDPNLIRSHDTTYAIESFSTRLPVTLRLGAGRSGSLANWTVQWEQGLNTAAGTSARPRLSGGVEWKKFTLVPLRAGLSLGGSQGLGLNWGGGIHLGVFRMDLGFGFNDGLAFSHAKGFDFAMNMGFQL